MRTAAQLVCVDAHAGGEVIRVLVSGVPTLEGSTIEDRRQFFKDHYDHIRRMIALPPRGHRDVVAALLVEPSDKHKADFGVIFMDPSGYLDMCGDGLIALSKVVAEWNLFNFRDTRQDVVFEAPGGMVKCSVRLTAGEVGEIAVHGQPSFLLESGLSVDLGSSISFSTDIAFGGNVFALIDARQLAMPLGTAALLRLRDMGMAVKEALGGRTFDDPWGAWSKRGVGLVMFYDLDHGQQGFRNVVVWGEGSVVSSPCGTGSCATLALLHTKGILDKEVEVDSVGPSGEAYRCKVSGTLPMPGGEGTAVLPVFSGRGYVTGVHYFLADEADPMKYGYWMK